MPWLQISVPVDRALAERTAEEIQALGAAAVTLEDAGEAPVLEPAPGETPLWPTVVVTALFDDSEPNRLMGIVDTDAWQSRHGFHLSRLADRAWEREWLKDFRSMRFGRRLWVCPGDQPPPDDPQAVILRLDPGLAFGTGTHPTTALCLEWLDAHAPAGKRVIDFGCGSGVLAIAAARLGARDVAVFDIDPQALEATRENSTRNGVADRIQVLSADVPLPATDLLIANILAGPLIDLAPVFSRALSAGTELVLSGILAAQADSVVAAYAGSFEFPELAEKDGWMCLAGRRRETD